MNWDIQAVKDKQKNIIHEIDCQFENLLLQ